MKRGKVFDKIVKLSDKRQFWSTKTKKIIAFLKILYKDWRLFVFMTPLFINDLYAKVIRLQVNLYSRDTERLWENSSKAPEYRKLEVGFCYMIPSHKGTVFLILKSGDHKYRIKFVRQATLKVCVNPPWSSSQIEVLYQLPPSHSNFRSTLPSQECCPDVPRTTTTTTTAFPPVYTGRSTGRTAARRRSATRCRRPAAAMGA